MSILLDDIIALAIDGKQPLTDILRKCLLLGHELKNERLKMWANQELNGYQSSDDVPDYRVVRAGAKGHFMGHFGEAINHYPLPSAILEDMHKDFARIIRLKQGVSAYEATVRSPDTTMLMFPWPTDMVLYYQRKFLSDYGLVSAWQDVSKSMIIELLDTVRNRTLNMALEIKENLGASYVNLGQAKSQEVATTIQNIIFQNTGGSTNVAFGNASVDASGQTVITAGDRHGLDSVLTKAGLDQSDLESLTEAIKADGGQKPGMSVTEWIKSKASKVVSGGIKVGVSIGQQLLTTWLMHYYGIKT